MTYRPPPADGYMRWADDQPTYRPKDPETGEWPVPKEGDLVSPFSCERCYYTHPMKWEKRHPKEGGTYRLLVCYRCDNFIIPPKPSKRD